jgi:hypothetical protein
MNRWCVCAIPVVMLMISSCGSSNLDRESTEACSAFAAWDAEGRPGDRQEQVVDRIATLLEESESTALAEPFGKLPAAVNEGDQGRVGRAGDSFSQACSDQGWEPTEG